MTKWFVSDLHLDDRKLFTGLRGESFSSVPEWSDFILDAINSKIKKSDHIYLLGDICRDNLHKWRMRFHTGQLWLIRGNHDPLPTVCRNVFGGQYRDVMEIKFGDSSAWLSHYAHAFWPKSHYGAYHFYGHNHSQRESTLDQWMPQRRSMDVCPESIYAATGEWGPISEQTLLDLLSARKGHDPVEFYIQSRGKYTK